MSNYPLIEIVSHRTSADAAAVAAEEAAAWLGICCLSGSATVALPGGRSPAALLSALAAYPIDWPRITVTTTDERQVPVDHALSNIGSVLKAFGSTRGQAASFVALDCAGAATQVRLPFDLVILGMGADGHIASLFPGRPMDGVNFPALIEVQPNPLPPEAPAARRSWSLSALASARRTLLVFTGEAKRAAFEAALTGSEETPVGALIRRARCPVTVHWAEA